MCDYNVPIYCSERIVDAIMKRHHHFLKPEHKRIFKTFSENDFTIKSLGIHAFEVIHDSEGGCFGYNIFTDDILGSKKISIATDLAEPENGLVKEFVNSDIMVIEANHDVEMLDNSTRTVWLKNRIKTTGHLSNEQCAELVIKVLQKSQKHPHTVVLAHISQQCNTNELAEKCIADALHKHNFGHVRVSPTFQGKPGSVISV